MSFFRPTIASIIISIFSYNLAYLILFLGVNKRVYNYVPGECSTVPLGDEEVYATDFDSFKDRIIFPYITSSNKTGFFAYEARNKSAHQLLVNDRNLKEFYPEAISIFKRRVFVVNHRSNEETIEIMSVNKQTATIKHHYTIRSKKFHRISDIVAIDKDKFYGTIWNEERNELNRLYKEYMGKDYGSIILFDGKNTRYVDRNVLSPSGITYEDLSKRLYVSSFSSQTILIYSISPSFSITRIGEIPIYSSPSKLWKGLDNSLIVSTQPIRYRSILNRLNKTSHYSPSLILRIHTSYSDDFNNLKIDTLYANDGATVSGSSSAIVGGTSLFISGSNNQILSCPLQPYVSFSLTY